MSEVVTTQVASLERQKVEFQKALDLRQSALRLAGNSDFQKVITKGFMLEEAARYVQSSCDPALDAVSRADALGIAQASGHLKRYLSVCIQMGNHAEHELASLDEQIEEARAEEGAL